MSSLEKSGFFVLYLLLLLLNESLATPVVKIENDVTDKQLPRVTLPISYDIKIGVSSIDDPIFNGESRITVRFLEETCNLTLHSKNLWISENFTSLVDANGKIHKPKKHTFGNATNFLVIEFGKPISAGIYTLNLNYTGAMVHGIRADYYRDEDGVRRRFIETTFYPSNARAAFPCWDEFGYDATFNLSIKHCPNLTAVSNMPAYRVMSVSNGKIWTNFETTPPIPVNRLGFVLSEVDCRRSDNKKFSFCDRKEFSDKLKNTLDITQRAISIVKRHIGVPYIKRTINQVAKSETKHEPWTLRIRGATKYTGSNFKGIDMSSAMEEEDATVAQNIAYEILTVPSVVYGTLWRRTAPVPNSIPSPIFTIRVFFSILLFNFFIFWIFSSFYDPWKVWDKSENKK